jgi:hypothetical protein
VDEAEQMSRKGQGNVRSALFRLRPRRAGLNSSAAQVSFWSWMLNPGTMGMDDETMMPLLAMMPIVILILLLLVTKISDRNGWNNGNSKRGFDGSCTAVQVDDNKVPIDNEVATAHYQNIEAYDPIQYISSYLR